jgi:hypothetical protein
MTTTALQLLPRVLAAMDKCVLHYLPDGDGIFSAEALDGWTEIVSPETAALRNALPGVAEMAQTCHDMLTTIRRHGIDRQCHLDRIEATAQRILDAIQQAVTPETWAAWTKEG